MPKVTVIFLFAILTIGVTMPCYSQQDQGEARMTGVAEGIIFDLDWAGSKMTVKGSDASGSGYYEMVLDVPDNAVMKRGSEQVDFSELEINDVVTVTYYQNSDGTGTLISLEDMTPSP